MAVTPSLCFSKIELEKMYRRVDFEVFEKNA